MTNYTIEQRALAVEQEILKLWHVAGSSAASILIVEKALRNERRRFAQEALHWADTLIYGEFESWLRGWAQEG